MWEYIVVATIVAAATFWLLRRTLQTIHRAFKPGGQPVSCQGCPNSTLNKGSKSKSQVKMLVNLQGPSKEESSPEEH